MHRRWICVVVAASGCVIVSSEDETGTATEATTMAGTTTPGPTTSSTGTESTGPDAPTTGPGESTGPASETTEGTTGGPAGPTLLVCSFVADSVTRFDLASGELLRALGPSEDL